MLLLDQLIDRLTAPDDAPWRGRSYAKPSRGGEGDRETTQAQLHALVLTRNRDIAANIKVSEKHVTT